VTVSIERSRAGSVGSRTPWLTGLLLVDLDGLVEELRVEVLDLFHGHVVLFHERHDLVAGDVAALLANLQEVLDVHDGANVDSCDVSFSLHCLVLS